jgi:two-component system, chemotaxis family, sensor kinase Cph1
VRVLIAESQLAAMRDAVLAAAEPVVVTDGSGRILLVNDALSRLLAGPHRTLERIEDLARSFEESAKTSALLQQVLETRRPYRGELTLTRPGLDAPVPVALRADPIPAVDGSLFGVVVMMTDLTSRKEAQSARSRLQRAIFAAQRPMPVPGSDATRPLSPAVQALIAAIWANAGVAASELADSADTASIAPLLAEVESATRHAAHLSAMLGHYAEGDGTGT